MDFYGRYYKFIRWLVRLVYPRCVIVGEIPDDPVIYVTHHRDRAGPFYTMLWYPGQIRPWALHVFCGKKKCFDHLYGYTYTVRRGMAKPIAYIAAKISSRVFSRLMISGGAIPVYRGSTQIRETFKLSVEALCRGESIVIFPDVDYKSTEESAGEFYKGFLHIDRPYFAKTGRHIGFAPIYACEHSKTLYFGKPVYFNDAAAFAAQKQRVCDELRDGLNALVAQSGKEL